jgi:1-deoxy-D-xylulose-5-phosphate reductoisomerase
VGANTRDVIARHPDRFEVFALSAATQVDLMLQQCAQFQALASVWPAKAGRSWRKVEQRPPTQC